MSVLVNCPTCRGEGFMALGPYVSRPLAAFDITSAQCAGDRVCRCHDCGGVGRVSPREAEVASYRGARLSEFYNRVLGRGF